MLLGNVSPTMVEPIHYEMGARQWMNKLVGPISHTREPNGEGQVGEWVRLPAADQGADLQWMADTGGDHDADSIAQAIGRMLGTTVAGAPVWAQRPDADTCEHMVAVRVPPGQAATIRAMAVQLRPYTWLAESAEYTL